MPKPQLPEQPVLVARVHARILYLGGVSRRSIHRLEQDGVLTPVRLSRKPNAKIYYRRDELERITKKKK